MVVMPIQITVNVVNVHQASVVQSVMMSNQVNIYGINFIEIGDWSSEQ